MRICRFPQDGAPLFRNADKVTGGKSWCKTVDGLTGTDRDEIRSSHCTDKHKAGTSTSSGSVRYNRTGVFGMFCAHGACLLACHMDVGERYAYPAMCLYVLVKEKQGPVKCVWYDIGPCKFREWWLKFVAALPPELASEQEKEWMRQCVFPLCTFHRFMHIIECQEKWAAETFVGVGTGAGEPPEQFWARAGALAKRTEYSRLVKVVVVLEAFISSSNYKKDVRYEHRPMNLCVVCRFRLPPVVFHSSTHPTQHPD